jgi:ribosomal protein S18 acetylase RimI-like enzyme
VTVRAAGTEDVGAIRALAIGNGMFAPDDMGGFDAELQSYLDGTSQGSRWIVARDDDERMVGAGYYAPEPFGDRVWNLYFLAVDEGRHRLGVGSALVEHVEQALRAEGEDVARVLIVETSSGAAYEGARRFYARQGFVEEAVIREYYGPGEAKIVFWKTLV